VIYIRLNELLEEHQKRHRLEKPISLRELAERIDVHRESLRRFAANKMDRIPVDVVEKVCLFFNCDIGELLLILNDDEEIKKNSSP